MAGLIERECLGDVLRVYIMIYSLFFVKLIQ